MTKQNAAAHSAYMMAGDRSLGLRALKRHYTPQEIAEALKVSVRTVQRMFQDRPGVFSLGSRFHPKKRVSDFAGTSFGC